MPSGPRMRTVAVGMPMEPHTTCSGSRRRSTPGVGQGFHRGGKGGAHQESEGVLTAVRRGGGGLARRAVPHLRMWQAAGATPLFSATPVSNRQLGCWHSWETSAAQRSPAQPGPPQPPPTTTNATPCRLPTCRSSSTHTMVGWCTSSFTRASTSSSPMFCGGGWVDRGRARRGEEREQWVRVGRVACSGL